MPTIINAYKISGVSGGSAGTFTNCPTIISVDCNKIKWTNESTQNVFTGSSNLTTVTNIRSSITEMINTFCNCSNLTTIDAFPPGVIDLSNTFRNCQALKTVPTIPNSVTNMSSTFLGCSSLETTPVIPNSVTNTHGTFQGCTNLVNVQPLPNSITHLYQMFYGCTNLKTAPTLPNSITTPSATFKQCINLINPGTLPNSIKYLDQTYEGCTSLVNMPVLPSSVIKMSSTFKNCTSLTNVQPIPQSVTNMSGTFDGCTSLTGNITILAANITGAANCFNNSSLRKNVYIPFGPDPYNPNSKTYNAFIAAGYDNAGTQNNVYLYSLDMAKVTINPTPSSATVELTAPGYSPQGNTIYVKQGIEVTYTVSQYGYITETATVSTSTNPDQTISVNLTKRNFIYTINPIPIDATVVLTGTGGTQTENSISVPYNTTVTWTVSKEDYLTKTGTWTVTKDYSQTISLKNGFCTLTINPIPTNATVQLNASEPGYEQVGNSITVPYGTDVGWSVTAPNCTHRSGTYIYLTEDIISEIALNEVESTSDLEVTTAGTGTWTPSRSGIYDIVAVSGGGGGALYYTTATAYNNGQPTCEAGGGGGSLLHIYCKLEAGTTYTYQVGAGGTGQKLEYASSDKYNLPQRGSDGGDTKLGNLFTLSGGTGGLTNVITKDSIIYTAGRGGEITLTVEPSFILASLTGNSGEASGGKSKAGQKYASGGASLYLQKNLDYIVPSSLADGLFSGAGGMADGTRSVLTTTNGKDGYLRIKFLTPDPAYESDIAGTESVSISRSGIYEITIVGAGGAGAEKVYPTSDTTEYTSAASGGSGGYVKLYRQLEKNHNYFTAVGKGRQFEDNFSDWSITEFFDRENTEDPAASANCGGSGLASTTPVAGQGGTVTGQYIIESQPGNAGQTSITTTSISGGASTYNGYGMGGSSNGSGKNGYVNIKWISDGSFETNVPMTKTMYLIPGTYEVMVIGGGGGAAGSGGGGDGNKQETHLDPIGGE